METCTVAVVYHSVNSHVAEAAKEIERGLLSSSRINVLLGSTEEISIQDLVECQTIVIGSPTYFANVSSVMKEYFESTIQIWEEQKFLGKLGASFTVSGGVCGDKALNLNMINHFMLMHGMIIVGNPKTSDNTDLFHGLGLKTQQIHKHGALLSPTDYKKAYQFGVRIAVVTSQMFG